MRRHETESTMPMLGSTSYVPKEPYPSVSSPKLTVSGRYLAGNRLEKKLSIHFMGGWWPSKVSKGLSYRLTFLIDSPQKNTQK